MDVTASSRTGELHKGHGIAFADLDNDGDEDIVAEIGGARRRRQPSTALVRESWSRKRLDRTEARGRQSNRAAIGARIKLTVEHEGRGTRSIYRSVGSGGSFGASPLEQHIGLGKSARIVDLEIWWPGAARTSALLAWRRINPGKSPTARNYPRLERRPIASGERGSLSERSDDVHHPKNRRHRQRSRQFRDRFSLTCVPAKISLLHHPYNPHSVGLS